MNNVGDVLQVAGGNKELLIDIKPSIKLQLAALILVAMIVGSFTGVLLASKL